jgi:hypothetical protein
MKERSNNTLADRVETAGVYSVGLGLISTVVSGIAFIASEQNLSSEDLQRLTTEINPLFAVAVGSIILSGAGVGLVKLGEAIKKK